MLPLILGLLAAGCVQRTMSINSEPPGALVYLNGQEVGRTPMRTDFLWYGTYDIELRKEGYETLKTRQQTIAPWWQWVPFDLVAEFFPLRDDRAYNYALTQAGDPAIDQDQILARAAALRAMVEQSKVKPATRPAN